jgi:uncharacterized membrane protein
MALLIFAPLADVVRLVTHDPFWSRMAFYTAFAGATLGAVTALPTLVDWLAAPRSTRERRVRLVHLLFSVAGVALAWASAIVRLTSGAAAFARLPFALALLGAGLLLLGGWFGGELVERMGLRAWPAPVPRRPSEPRPA